MCIEHLGRCYREVYIQCKLSLGSGKGSGAARWCGGEDEERPAVGPGEPDTCLSGTETSGTEPTGQRMK